MANNRFKDTFKTSKIGTGKLHASGSFTSRSPRGLAGALRQAKMAGKHSFAKNLSHQDLTVFHGLIGKEMARIGTHSQGLPRQARLRIMSTAEKLRREGKISGADKQDLKQIVEALKPASDSSPTPQKYVAPKKPTERVSMPQHGAPQQEKEMPKGHDGKPLTPKQLTRMRAYIAMDMGDELSAEDRGESTTHYDPRSVLGKRVIDQVDRERASREKKIETEHGKHEKLNRPNQTKPNTKDIIQVETLPDMDIG